MTVNGNYVITVKDWPALTTLKTTLDSDPIAARNAYIAKANEYGQANPNATAHEASIYALLKLYGGAINLYKATAATTTYKPLTLTSNKVADLACP